MSGVAYNRLKALVLILMAIFLANLLVSHDLGLYLGPRVSWSMGLAIVLMILIAGSLNISRPEQGATDFPTRNGPIWQLLAIVAPLVVALISPAVPLGADAVAGRGVTNRWATGKSSDLPKPVDQNVLEWAQAIGSNTDPAALSGQPADVTGFVYRDSRFKPSQFLLTRIALVCCPADAAPIGVVVDSKWAELYPTNSWARVTGAFQTGDLNGEAIPVLAADDIAPVQQPESPYLYP